MNSFKPFKTDQELLDFAHSLTGVRKHDEALGKKLGMSRFQISVFRQMLGKIEYERKTIPNENRQDIISDYKDGMATLDIAAKYGMSVSAVYGVLERGHCDRDRRDFWTPIKCKQLIHMRDVKKMQWKDIGMALGRSLQCVQQKYTSMKRQSASGNI